MKLRVVVFVIGCIALGAIGAWLILPPPDDEWKFVSLEEMDRIQPRAFGWKQERLIEPSPPAPAPKSNPEGRIEVDPESGVPLLVIDDSAHAPEPPPPPPPPLAEKKSGEHHYVEWLIDPKVHPLVNEIPRSAQGTYQDVASWVAAHERDPFERVKILHDFIATRIAYEYPYDRDNLPPSEPDVVFARRRAVCAGYARLFKAMYEVMNGRAVYISGEARFATEGMAGSSHAWNAAEIEGRWYLVDITWDAGGISNGRFQPKYRTDFLLTPPDFFIFSHYPFRDSWQLRTKPITQDEFHHQPLLFPSFIAFDLKLIEPARSQFTVRGALEVVLGNPGGHSVLVEFRSRSQAIDRRRACAVRDAAPRTVATCMLPEPGEYVVYVFAALRGESVHDVVAKLEVARE